MSWSDPFIYTFISCRLNTKFYPTEIKVSDQQMAELNILRHPTLPNWNDTLFPRQNRN